MSGSDSFQGPPSRPSVASPSRPSVPLSRPPGAPSTQSGGGGGEGERRRRRGRGRRGEGPGDPARAEGSPRPPAPRPDAAREQKPESGRDSGRPGTRPEGRARPAPEQQQQPQQQGRRSGGPQQGGERRPQSGRPPREERRRDAGSREGGPREGGAREGGLREGGSRDSGSRDGGSREGGPRDGGPRDSGSRDGGRQGRDAKPPRRDGPSQPGRGTGPGPAPGARSAPQSRPLMPAGDTPRRPPGASPSRPPLAPPRSSPILMPVSASSPHELPRDVEDGAWPTAADWESAAQAPASVPPRSVPPGGLPRSVPPGGLRPAPRDVPPPATREDARATTDDTDDGDDDAPPRLLKVSTLEPPPPEVPVKFARIVGVKLRAAGPIREYDSRDDTYAAGDFVLVDSDRGPRLAKVVVGTQRTYALGTLRRVLRKARDTEVASQDQSARIETEAYTFCKERLRERRLPMKLVQVEVHAGHKATFYFASEERLDFRDLVRDLAQRFHLRIEMRQIGARDGAKAVGGLGSCGRELCCTTFLPSFQPVSIRMAKDQGMVLNPSKLAGQCGRLKCCLVYEHQTYKELGKGLPKVGKRVVTPGGSGRVLDVDILRQRVRVYLEDGGAQSFAAAEVRPDRPPQGPGQGPGQGQGANQGHARGGPDGGRGQAAAVSRETPEPAEPEDAAALRGLDDPG